MKFSILGLFAITAAVAAVFGTFVTFSEYGKQDHLLWLGLYLVAVSLVTTACFSGYVPLRGAFRATAIFGWAYSLFVLKAGFGIDYPIPTKIGLALMGTCFLIALTAITLAKPIQGEKRADGS